MRAFTMFKCLNVCHKRHNQANRKKVRTYE
nr:MAG TPA: hypothetical protein [Caudoviricetes sp.]DAW91772.1 MAG TPA: hypothetical protein [Caudoviricetes sp.]